MQPFHGNLLLVVTFAAKFAAGFLMLESGLFEACQDLGKERLYMVELCCKLTQNSCAGREGLDSRPLVCCCLLLLSVC